MPETHFYRWSKKSFNGTRKDVVNVELQDKSVVESFKELPFRQPTNYDEPCSDELSSDKSCADDIFLDSDESITFDFTL